MEKSNVGKKHKGAIVFGAAILCVTLLVTGGICGATIEKASISTSKREAVAGLPVTIVGSIKNIGQHDLILEAIDAEEVGGKHVNGQPVTLVVDSRTSFYSTEINEKGMMAPKVTGINQLKKKDVVTVEANLSNGKTLTIRARRVLISPDKKTTENARYQSPMKDGRVIYGFASLIDAGGFTLTDTDGKAIRVDVDDATEVVAGGSASKRPMPATYAAVVSGVRLSLFGDISADGHIMAKSIAVGE